MHLSDDISIDTCGAGASYARTLMSRGPFSHVIVIDSGGGMITGTDDDHRLSLRFDDIAPRRRPAPWVSPPDLPHVAAIIAFARTARLEGRISLLCRCHTGIRRAPAAALIAAAAVAPPGVTMATVVADLYREHPEIEPDRELLALAAPLLRERGAELVAAQSAHAR